MISIFITIIYYLICNFFFFFDHPAACGVPGPGIEPVSQCSQDATNAIVPQRELLLMTF